MTVFADPRVRTVALIVYYLAVLAAAFVIAARDAFSAPPFVYQGF